jgi:hypothetical protein
MLGKVIQ